MARLRTAIELCLRILMDVAICPRQPWFPQRMRDVLGGFCMLSREEEDVDTQDSPVVSRGGSPNLSRLETCWRIFWYTLEHS